jgi:hypothetical protein
VGLLILGLGVLVWSTVTRLAAWRRKRHLPPAPVSIADEAHAWLELQ